jgi:hypothetical protein
LRLKEKQTVVLFTISRGYEKGLEFENYGPNPRAVCLKLMLGKLD